MQYALNGTDHRTYRLFLVYIFKWDISACACFPGPCYLDYAHLYHHHHIMQPTNFPQKMGLSAKLSGLVFALLSGVQKIKLAGAEKRAFAKWANIYKEEGRLTYSPPLFLRINPAISTFITMGGSLVLYYIAGASRITPADYMAFNVAYGAVSGAIMALGGIAMTVASIKPLLEMVQPILDTVPENSENKRILTTLSGNVEVNHLSFRYDKDGPAILDDVSFKIRPGEYVAIVGKTGCGKSTLMRLLLGFEKPETGAVYYDGHDLETLDLRSVRQCIGVDLQNGKLFSGDIFSNIIITAPWKTLDDAWEAARIAGLEEDIKAMPMGMHTMLRTAAVFGQAAPRLPGSYQPKILYFDEATSALDNVRKVTYRRDMPGWSLPMAYHPPLRPDHCVAGQDRWKKLHDYKTGFLRFGNGKQFREWGHLVKPGSFVDDLLIINKKL